MCVSLEEFLGDLLLVKFLKSATLEAGARRAFRPSLAPKRELFMLLLFKLAVLCVSRRSQLLLLLPWVAARRCFRCYCSLCEKFA